MKHQNSNIRQVKPVISSNRNPLWICILIFALVEVVAHVASREHLPSMEAWWKAADYIRKNFKQDDAITVAPMWADPILRWVLGDLISLSDAGRSDMTGYRRLWALTMRNKYPAEAPNRKAELSRKFGAISVLRWELPRTDVRFDLVEQIHKARVTIDKNGRRWPCQLRRLPQEKGGGLGKGVLPPVTRFVCDPNRPWLFVTKVVLEDLHLTPRTCVWQHPVGRESIRVTYQNIPFGEQLRFYGGLYYEHERDLEGGPVQATIEINGHIAGEFTHRDGDGWKKLNLPIPRHYLNKTGNITIDVTAAEPHKRSFCWAAKMVTDTNYKSQP